VQIALQEQEMPGVGGPKNGRWVMGSGRIQLSLRRNCMVLGLRLSWMGLGVLGLSLGQWSLVAGINRGAKWHELGSWTTIETMMMALPACHTHTQPLKYREIQKK